MSASPLVSVVMPVHNGERNLGEALRSVFELGIPRLEVILVDDGSTDGSVSVAVEFGEAVRIVSQANAGPAAARNRGVGLARGEILGLLDADDRWTPDLAQIVLPLLIGDDGLDMAQGRIQKCRRTADGVDVRDAPYEYLNLGSGLYRRRVFDAVGLFDERLRMSEDYDWMLRAFDARVRKRRVAETTLLYRIHERSTTRGRSVHEVGMARSHKKAAERRRRNPDLMRPPDGFPSLAEYMGRGPDPSADGDVLPLTRSDDRRIDPPADAILAFMVVRNEATRLPFCLDYHRGLGVSRFFVVDNGSEDGSVDWLLRQPDAHVWRTTASFSAARCGTDWIESLLRAHGQGHWCLVVDADELLVYPGSEAMPLAEFCARLDRAGHRAAMTLMIDMYSDRPLRDTHVEAGQPFTDVCRFFDRRVFHDTVERFHQHDQHPSFFGGVRRRVFGGRQSGQDERFFYCLNKVPLLRYDPSFVLSDNLHWTSCREVAVQAGGLLHFKFFADFADHAAREAERKEHWNEGAQYASYARALAADPGLTLFDPVLSTRYEQSGQLVGLGLLRPLVSETGRRATFPPGESTVAADQTRMIRQVRGLIKARKSHEYNAHAEGMDLLKRGQWREAAAAFRIAARESPEFSWSHHYLGDALTVLQEWPDAIAAYRRATELNPHFAASHFNLGELFARLEQWSDATDCYRRALHLDPDLPSAARSLARTLVRQSRDLEREAQQWYGRAHVLDPADMTIYAEAVGLRPPDPELCVRFADALAGRHHRTKAIFFYQLALQLRPDDAAAHARLAAVLRQEGDLAGAVSCCRRAALLADGQPEYHAQLGALLAEQGEAALAIAAYQRSVELQPDRPAWLKELGDLFARTGRLDEAAAAYAQAVSHGYQPY